MASLLDLVKKAKEYFNPTSNAGQNFWSTPTANRLANVQRGMQQIPQQVIRISQTPINNFNQNVRQIPTIANNFLRDQTQKVEQSPIFSPSLPQTIGNIGTKFITSQLKQSVYNPDTRKVFPASPLREENAPIKRGITTKSPEDFKKYITSNEGINRSLQPIIGMLGGTPQSIATQTLLSRSRSNAIKAAEPEISSMVNSLKNINKFSPSGQMQIIADAEKLAQRIIPDIMKRPELKSLKNSSQAADYLNVLGKSLEDRLMTAFNPQLNIGNNVRRLQTQQPIQQSLRQQTTKPQSPVVSTSLSSEKLQPKIQSTVQSKAVSQVPEVSSTPYFNTKRLNVSTKTKKFVDQAVQEAKPAIEQLVGKRLSNKEAIETANVTAKTLNRAVERETTKQWEAALINARQQLAKASETGIVDEKYIQNLATVKSLGTDIARKLQSFSIGADAKELTGKQAILEAVLKVNDNFDQILKASKGVDFNDINQATNFYRQFVKPKAGEWVDLLRYNSMLSSPNTHINNIASNFQGSGLITPLTKTITGSLDAFKSAITGSERKYLAGEGVAYSKGYLESLGAARQKFYDVMSGKTLSQNPDIRSLPLSTGGKSKAVESVLSYPMRLLEASDQFFTTLAQGGLEKSNQFKLSRGIKITSNPIDEAKKILFRGELGENQGSHALNALDTFANGIQRYKSSDNPIVSTIAKYTFPFIKTPTNVLKQGLEYSPAGLTTLYGAANKTEQLAKAMLGSSVALGVATLLGGDSLTWSEPTDPTKKAQFRAAGMQPYSVKIGDKWVSYSKLHPAIAFNIALVSSLKNAEDNKTLDQSQVDTVLNGVSKWWQFFADQSFVKNMGDFISSTKGDTEGAAKYLSNYPQQLIPFRALMGWIERITDPYQRQVDSDGSILEKQLQQVATQIPGFAQTVPKRLDQKGQPIMNQNRVFNAFSPLRVTTENPQAKSIYDASVRKTQNTRNENIVKDRVMKTGNEETFNGKKYFVGKEFDSKKGEYNPVIKSVKVPQSSSDIYKNLRKEYQTEDDSPQGLLDKIGVYGTGIFKDPAGTINAIKTGQPIRKVRGDAVVLERLKNLDKLDQGDKATQVDHVIAVALGGSNDESNLAIISKQDNQVKGLVDTYLAKELDAGRITKKVAQERDLNWRNELQNLPVSDQNKAKSILAKTQQVPTKVNTGVLDTITTKEFEPVKTGTGYANIQVNIPEPLKLTGQPELDKQLKSKYSSAVSAAKTNIGKLYLDGQLTAEEANKAIASLTSIKIKTTGSGGGKSRKGKAVPKMAKVSTRGVNYKIAASPKRKLVGVQKISRPNLKSIKIGSLKTPKIKVASVKLPNIKIAKIKGLTVGKKLA